MCENGPDADVVDLGDGAPRTVDVEISADTVDKVGVHHLRIEDIALPVSFDELCKLMVDMGYEKPKAFQALPEHHHIQVTEGSSTFSTGDNGGSINIDEPLLHFYNKHFLPVVAAAEPKSNDVPLSYMSEATISHDGSKIEISGVQLRYRRTVRVPDDDETHAPPPDMGAFMIYNVADFVDRLPKSIVSKGGAFISMFQREAMWIAFHTTHSSRQHALKIAVDGVNALTGLLQDESAEEKQDYLPVGNENGQLWLDGIAVAPGIVRQLTPKPLGRGYTKSQIIGKEAVRGMQIDVYSMYPTGVLFTQADGSILNLYHTPRELGMDETSYLIMEDLQAAPVTLGAQSSLASSMVPIGPTVRLAACSDFFVCVDYTDERPRKVIIYCDPSDNIHDIRVKIQVALGVSPSNQRLTHNGTLMHDQATLHDYGVKYADTLTLRCAPVGGGFSTHEAAGFAAGARISQNMVHDTLPPAAYDQTSGARLHVAVLSPADFAAITGTAAPPSPIDAQTYLALGLPWCASFEEHIPGADSAPPTSVPAGVQSVAALDAPCADGTEQPACGVCGEGMATTRLVPCSHVLCGGCVEGQVLNTCPLCDKLGSGRERFASAMPIPGHEGDDGGGAASLDDKIAALAWCAANGKVGSFRLEAHRVSDLSGEI